MRSVMRSSPCWRAPKQKTRRVPMESKFSTTELTALRTDLQQGGMVASVEAAELLQFFLMGRGYGVSRDAARDAAGRIGSTGYSLTVLQHELENLAMLM